MRLVDELAPNMVLIDSLVPAGGGMTLTAQLKQRHPYLKVLLISDADDVEMIEEALMAGVWVVH